MPAPVYRVYDVNVAAGGPIVKDRLWYDMSVREQGSRQNTLNTFYNKNAGNANSFLYEADLTRPAFSDRTWENYTPRITWQISSRNKITGSWDEQPVCRKCSGTTSLTGSPNFVWFASPESDGHGEFSPQRIQQVRWTSPLTSKLLLEAGFGTTYYEWGGKQLEDTSTENLVQMLNLSQAVTPTFSTAMRYRSQFWLNNKTRGSQFNASAAYITGSHSLKFGYQGAYWRDDREQHVNSQSLGYIGVSIPGVPFFPIQINQYINPFVVNARAMQASFFAQDSWTMNRLTLQGAVRWDHPWSWFPEQTIPRQRFFPGATFAKSDGVTGYNDLTPRLGACGRSLRHRQDGAEGQPWQVPARRQREQPGLRCESDAAHPDGWRHLDDRAVFLRSARLLESVRVAELVRRRLRHDAGLQPGQPAGERRVRPDRQPAVRQQPAGGRQLRSGPLQRLGRASLRLVVRRVGTAGDLPASVGGGRLLPEIVHAVLHRRDGDGQPGDRAERRRPPTRSGCRPTRACPTAATPSAVSTT